MYNNHNLSTLLSGLACTHLFVGEGGDTEHSDANDLRKTRTFRAELSETHGLNRVRLIIFTHYTRIAHR